tara:strand:+ start:49695 stop:49997 length:303 start_codon:yes stop_codon:yes gene_type:complete
MANYIELRGLFNNDDLVNRTSIAVIVSITNLLAGTPSANDKAYASLVLSNPQKEAKKVLMTVLAANKGATVAQIKNATDTTLQTQVDSIVPHLIDALAGV